MFGAAARCSSAKQASRHHRQPRWRTTVPLVHVSRARSALSFCTEAIAQRRALSERLAVETALGHGNGTCAIEFCVRGDEGADRKSVV